MDRFVEMARRALRLSPSGRHDGKLRAAVDNGNAKRVRRITKRRGICPTAWDEHGHTLLNRAAAAGRANVVELFLNSLIDVNATDFRGKTACHNAARYGRPVVLKMLLEAGGDVRALDSMELTALHLAVIGGSLECLQLLRQFHAPVDATDREDRTPLHYASILGYVELAEKLIEDGAKINESDMYQKTALILAAEYGNTDVCDLLVRRGADPSFLDHQGHDAAWYAGQGCHKDATIRETIEKATLTPCLYTIGPRAAKTSNDQQARVIGDIAEEVSGTDSEELRIDRHKPTPRTEEARNQITYVDSSPPVVLSSEPAAPTLSCTMPPAERRGVSRDDGMPPTEGTTPTDTRGVESNYVISEDGQMYQNVDSTREAANQKTSSDAPFHSTSERRVESTSPVVPARTNRPTDGAIIPMSDSGLIDSSDESESGNDVERTLSRWLDYRDCAVVPMSQQNTPTSLRRDSVEKVEVGEKTEAQPSPSSRNDSETSLSEETNVNICQSETSSLEPLEGAIVPLSEAVDGELDAEFATSTQVGNAQKMLPLEGAVVPLADAPDEGDEVMEGSATVRRMLTGIEAPIVTKRDSATEVDGDYGKDIAGIVELLNLKADRDVLATLLEKLTSEKNVALQTANRLIQLLRHCTVEGPLHAESPRNQGTFLYPGKDARNPIKERLDENELQNVYTILDDLQNNWTASNSSTFDTLLGDCTRLDQQLLRLQDNIRELSTRCTAPINVARVTMLQDACAKLQRDSIRLAENAGNLRKGRHTGVRNGRQSIPGITDTEAQDTDSSDTTLVDSYLDDPQLSDVDVYTVRQIHFDSPQLSPRQLFLSGNNEIASQKPCELPRNPMIPHRSEPDDYKFEGVTLITNDQQKSGCSGYNGDGCRSLPDVTLNARPCRRFTVAGNADGSTTPWRSAGSGLRERARSFSEHDELVTPTMYRTQIRSLTGADQSSDGSYNGNSRTVDGGASTVSGGVERVLRSSRTTRSDAAEYGANDDECALGYVPEDTCLNLTAAPETPQKITRSPGIRDGQTDNTTGRLFEVNSNIQPLLRKETTTKENKVMQCSGVAMPQPSGGGYYVRETMKSTNEADDSNSRSDNQRSSFKSDNKTIETLEHEDEQQEQEQKQEQDYITEDDINLDAVLLAFDKVDDTIDAEAGGNDQAGDPNVVEAAVQCCNEHSLEGAAGTELQNALTCLRAEQADMQKRYEDVVKTYRSHLLAAVQGSLDEDVKAALINIIRLRSK